MDLAEFGTRVLEEGHHSGAKYNEINILLFLALTWIYVILGGFLEHKHFTFMHITGIGIVIGFIIGMIFHFATSGSYDYANLEFNEKFFFYIILPPIIFAGGYNLQTRRFFYCFFYIALFGLIATLINFAITVGLTYLFNNNDLITVQDGKVVHLEDTDILLYSATVCSTDAIAALTMIDSAKYPKLFSVIFGEGMLNDAISIIIYATVFDLIVDNGNGTTSFEWHTPFKILGQFLLIIFASVAIGLTFGILSAIVTKYFRFMEENPIIEVTTIFIFGYMGYVICEILNLSGVIAILVCGIFMAQYTQRNLSITGKISSKVTLEFISMAAEGFLYMYIGISSWYYEGPFQSTHDQYDRPWSLVFLLYELGVCLVARFVGVFVLSWIVMGFNKLRGKNTFILNKWELSIIFFSGLIRGAIAYALVQTVPGKGISQEIVKATVFFIVVLTTLIMGSFIPIWIKFSLKIIETSDRYGPDHPSIFDPLAPENQSKLGSVEMSGSSTEQINKKTKRFENWFEKLDNKRFSPWFVYKYNQKQEQLEEEKEVLDQVITRTRSEVSRGMRAQSLQNRLRKEYGIYESKTIKEESSESVSDRSKTDISYNDQLFIEYTQAENKKNKVFIELNNNMGTINRDSQKIEQNVNRESRISEQL